MSEPNAVRYRPNPDYWAARKAANHWRCTQGHNHYLTTGLVQVYDGRVCGWSATLGDPHHATPGTVAIDAQGRLWQAHSDNDPCGATTWDDIEEPAYL